MRRYITDYITDCLDTKTRNSQTTTRDSIEERTSFIERFSFLNPHSRIDWSKLEKKWKKSKNLATEMLEIAVPSMISAGLLYACNFYITMMVYREGDKYVAAAGYINRFKAFFMISPSYFFWAMQSLLSRALDAKQKSQEGDSPDLIVIAAILLAVPLSLASMGLFSSVGYFLRAIGEDPDHIKLVEDYYAWDQFLFAVPAYVGLQIFIQLLPTANRANTLIYLALFRAVLDIGFSSLFMFQMNMGFSSWATANLIQTWGSFLACLGVFFSPIGKNLRKDIGFRKIMDYFNKDSFSLCGKFFNQGWPIAVQTCGAVLGGVLLTLFTGKFPEKDLTAFNITGAISYWSIILLEPFSTATNILVSKGNHAIQDIWKVGNLVACLLVVAPLSLAMIFAHRQLTKLYFHGDSQSKNDVLSLTSILMPLYSLFSLAYALKAVTAGVFRGKRDTLTPFITEMLGAFLVTVAGGAFFSFSSEKSIIGVGVSEVLGTVISMLLLNIVFSQIDFGLTSQKGASITYKAQKGRCLFGSTRDNSQQATVLEPAINSLNQTLLDNSGNRNSP